MSKKLLSIAASLWMIFWPAPPQKAYPSASDLQGGSITAAVTLSAAQVIALGGTPVTAVAAQGSGTWIILDNCVAQYKFGSAAFTNAGGRMVVGYLNGATTISNARSLCGFDNSGFVSLGISAVEYNAIGASYGQQSGNPVLDAQSVVANQPLSIATTGGSSPSGPGTGSTLTFYITYHVVTLQ